MADRSETIRLHKWQRCEEIESADVVPNCLHRPALITQPLEVGIIVGQQRIGWRQHNVAAIGQFQTVAVVGSASQTNYNLLPKLARGVQRNNGWRFGPRGQ